MRSPSSVILLALIALIAQIAFPSKSGHTLRLRYGQPVSETFLVRPGIVVSATYGKSGDVCELVISRKQQPNWMFKRWPGSGGIDNKTLDEIENELVPPAERGKFKISTLMGLVTCLPDNDCAGTAEDWEKIGTYRNAGSPNPRYETIQWNRPECARELGKSNESSTRTPSVR